MAMVYITNGETTSKVPYSAFVAQYKKLGFRIVADEVEGEKVPSDRGTTEDVQNGTETSAEGNAPEEAEDVDGTDVENEDEDEQEADEAAFVEDILEKPLSQWSTEELKEFVRIKNIDTAGAKKTSEVRSLVKKYLEEQEKASVNS